MTDAMDESQFDIFISYCHGDNVGAGEGAWVSEFKEDLSRRIQQKEGRVLNIYIDSSQTGLGGTLPDLLEETIQRSRYLLPVVSPLYVNSEWCESERVTFIETYGLDEALKRVIRVDKEPVMDVAGELEELKQYRFYHRDDGAGVELSLSKNHETSRYYQLITELALHILHDINAVSKARDNTIYVARTCKALNERRNDICKELEQRGFNVVPTSLGVIPDKAREKAVRYLSEAFMSVHLFSDVFEPILRDSAESLDRLQFEEAVALEGLQTLVYAPSAGELDEKQLALLQEAQDIDITDLMHNFIEFRGEVISGAIEYREQLEATSEMPCLSQPVNVYLHYGPEDDGCEDVRNIARLLTQANAEVFEPDFTQPDPHAVCAACPGILYYFGASPFDQQYLQIKMGEDAGGREALRAIYLKAGRELKNPTTRALLLSPARGEPLDQLLGVFVEQLQQVE